MNIDILINDFLIDFRYDSIKENKKTYLNMIFSEMSIKMIKNIKNEKFINLSSINFEILAEKINFE